MKRLNLDYEQIKATQVAAVEGKAKDLAPCERTGLGERVVPAELRATLARLRLLEGVPFSYLVPDGELLPPESIRFFHLDRGWTDALTQGVLSVGTVSSADRAELEGLYDAIREEIDEEERAVRMVGGEAAGSGPAGPISGFLLRSRAVSAYPGMHVRAYARDSVGDEQVVSESHPDRLRLLRLERLAPAVLLALFDGVPELVHVEEPHAGLQFGVRLGGGEARGSGGFEAKVLARDATSGEEVKPKTEIDVSFRRGSPGVLDLKSTAREFAKAKRKTKTGDDLDGAELALQMIRYPYRQVFGDEPERAKLDAVFRPSRGLALRDLRSALGGDDG